MYEAMRAAAIVSRVRGLPPADWVSTAEAFIMATEGSARVLGMGDFIGKIAKGYKADLVLLDLNHVNFVPLNNAIDQIVLTENSAAVDKVLIGGKLVVAGGRAIGIDRAALAAKAQAAVERLAALNADARRFAERIEPIVLELLSRPCRRRHDAPAAPRPRPARRPLRLLRETTARVGRSDLNLGAQAIRVSGMRGVMSASRWMSRHSRDRCYHRIPSSSFILCTRIANRPAN